MMKNALCYHKQWMVALLLVLAVLSLLWVGCGKKGPPRPPRRPLPPKVKDLAYSLRDDKVELSWTVPGAAGNSTSLPAAVKVFRFRMSAKEAGCENCPIRYTVSGDIPIQKKQAEKSEPIRMRYAESVEPGYRYIYKVTVYDEYGIAGKDSNVVKFDLHPD
jgi:predicted small lipoprotein YifL